MGDFLLSSFKESEGILTNSYSFVPDQKFRFEFNQNNTNSSCSRFTDFFGKRINKLTNSVLGLINHLAEDNEIRGEMKMIKNEMECLTDAMSQLDLQTTYPTINSNYRNFTNLIIAKLSQMEKIYDKLSCDSTTTTPILNGTKASNCKITLDDGSTPPYYLVASDFIFYDFQRLVGLNDEPGNDGNWILEPQNDNGLFRLKNVWYNEYLGSSIPWPSIQEWSYVITSSQYHSECSSQFLWTLENTSDGESYLKHNTNSYLYGDGLPVLVKNSYRSYWKLTCTG